MAYRYSAACGCDIGRIRKNNEDNFFFAGACLPEENGGLDGVLRDKGPLDGGPFFAVFDGMGGERCGETAAFAAASALKALAPSASGEPEELLLSMCERMNLAVCAEGEKLDYGRMGTTVCLLLLTGRKAYMLNVGDSRAYLFRSGGTFRLSRDHVARFAAVGAGTVRLTQHLGIFPDEMTLEPHLASAELRTNDRFLLCSDGLTDVLDDETLRRIVRERPPASAVRELIALAKERGSRDNISALTVRIY